MQFSLFLLRNLQLSEYQLREARLGIWDGDRNRSFWGPMVELALLQVAGNRN